MPQPVLKKITHSIPGGLISKSAHRLPKEYQHIASLMASVITGWTHTEDGIGGVLTAMLSAPSETQVNSMINSLQSTRAKIEILQSVLWSFNDNTLVSEFENFLNSDFKRAYKRRNEVAHGNWQWNIAYPDGLILNGVGGKPLKKRLVYKANDFEQSLNWVHNVGLSFLDFRTRFQSAERK